MANRLTLSVAASLLSVTANAAVLNLSHNNTSISIDDSTGTMTEWSVENQDNLFAQNFWYREGATGPNSLVDGTNLDLISSTTGFGDRAAELVYADSSGDFTITISYFLTGGPDGSGTSLLAEEITITNTSGGALDLEFFQYANFDLSATAGDDLVELINANTVRQTQGSLVMEETVATPGADLYSVGEAGTVLAEVSLSDLSNTGGPLSPS